MNLEDQLSQDLKTLGNSQPLPSSAGIDGLNSMVTARRRRRTAGTGVLAGAALATVAFFAVSAFNDDVEPIRTADQITSELDNDVDSDVDNSDAKDTLPDTGEGAVALPSPPAGETSIRVLISDPAGFVGAGSADGAPIIERSIDGESWERVATTGLPTSGTIARLAPIGDGYLALTTSESELTASWSTDMVQWTRANIPDFPPPVEGKTRSFAITHVLESPSGVLATGSYFDSPPRESGDIAPRPVISEDGPTPLGLLSAGLGQDFRAAAIPAVIPISANVSDGEYVISGVSSEAFSTPSLAGTGGLQVYTSVDGDNWTEPEIQDPGSYLGTTATKPDGSLVRIGDGSATQCCSVQTSADGGETWSYLASPATFSSLTEGAPASLHVIDAGPAGIVVGGNVFPSAPLDTTAFDIAALDGFSLPVEGGSLRFDPGSITEPASRGDVLSVAGVQVLLDDGTAESLGPIGGDNVDCCIDGVLTATTADGRKVTTTVGELRDAVDLPAFLKMEKDGYLLYLDNPMSPTALVSLQDDAGAIINAWPFAVLDSPGSAPGLEISAADDLIFSDPRTGEHLVTFTAEEGEAATAENPPSGLLVPTPGPGLTEPVPTPPDGIVYFSVDGVEWTALPTIAQASLSTVALGDDEVVVLINRINETPQRLRIPLPG